MPNKKGKECRVCYPFKCSRYRHPIRGRKCAKEGCDTEIFPAGAPAFCPEHNSLNKAADHTEGVFAVLPHAGPSQELKDLAAKIDLDAVPMKTGYVGEYIEPTEGCELRPEFNDTAAPKQFKKIAEVCGPFKDVTGGVLKAFGIPTYKEPDEECECKPSEVCNHCWEAKYPIPKVESQGWEEKWKRMVKEPISFLHGIPVYLSKEHVDKIFAFIESVVIPEVKGEIEMNYEIWKKLKDAGFPCKKIEGEGQDAIQDAGRFVDCLLDDNIGFLMPTLSELIAECGEKFHSLNLYLKQKDTHWRVRGGNVPHDIDNEQGWGYSMAGSTPEEAVANLWIVLNEKPDIPL